MKISKFYAFLALFFVAQVTAADYPTRPIRMLAGFTAGGGSDLAARYAHEFRRIGAELITGSAQSDDAENVDAALTARRMRDDLPLVVRLFDPVLARFDLPELAGHVSTLREAGQGRQVGEPRAGIRRP